MLISPTIFYFQMESDDPPANVIETLASAKNDEEFLWNLRRVEASQLTNEVIFNILKRMPNKKRKRGLSWKQIKESLSVIVEDPLLQITEQNLRTSMMSVKQQVNDLQKYTDI